MKSNAIVHIKLLQKHSAYSAKNRNCFKSLNGLQILETVSNFWSDFKLFEVVITFDKQPLVRNALSKLNFRNLK